MNDTVKRCLKERTKLTKFFHKNDQRKDNQEKLGPKAAYEQILKAKSDYVLKMS